MLGVVTVACSAAVGLLLQVEQVHGTDGGVLVKLLTDNDDWKKPNDSSTVVVRCAALRACDGWEAEVSWLLRPAAGLAQGRGERQLCLCTALRCSYKAKLPDGTVFDEATDFEYTLDEEKVCRAGGDHVQCDETGLGTSGERLSPSRCQRTNTGFHHLFSTRPHRPCSFPSYP